MENDAQAASWWIKASEKGHAEAQNFLAFCYEKGDGVAKDLAQAVSWYRKSAEQGNAMAQNKLGFYYYNGEVVARNEVEAYALWSLAGVRIPGDREKLAILIQKMSVDQIAAGKKRALELQKKIEATASSKNIGK
jgi:TPR repeat protein